MESIRLRVLYCRMKTTVRVNNKDKRVVENALVNFIQLAKISILHLQYHYYLNTYLLLLIAMSYICTHYCY